MHQCIINHSESRELARARGFPIKFNSIPARFPHFGASPVEFNDDKNNQCRAHESRAHLACIRGMYLYSRGNSRTNNRQLSCARI